VNVIGHRGCSDHLPENSLAAIRGSAEHVDMVEIDVQRCGSGEIVVFHDDTLDRLTDSTGRVSETPLEKIQSLRIGTSGERIPTLEAALDALPAGTGINVELKEAGMVDDVAPLLRELDQEVIVSSFESEALAEFAGESIPTGYLFAGSVSESIETAAELGCDSIHPLYELVDESLIEQARDHGFSVNAWTVPDRESVIELRELCVDGVIVDDWEIVPGG
jgi:glycerophosphoryl diester phosphodiesterase